MLNQKTILFFIIEAGLAHITRSLSIAEKLSHKGHKVLFALAKNKQYLVRSKNIQIINIGEFFGDDQLFDKIKNPRYLYPIILEELAILKKYQPDLAVIDVRLTAIVSCKKLKIPIAFVLNSDALLSQIYIPDFGLLPFPQRFMEPLFQKLIWNFKSKYFTTLIETAKMINLKLTMDDFRKMTFIVPEPPGYLPPKDHSDNTHYVGPIWWNGFKNDSPAWLKSIKPNGRTIYLTFGGTGYDPKKLIELSYQLVEKGYRVIVSASNIVDPKKFKNLKNLYVEKFLPGFKVCQRVDLVICHGGIGTLLQALSAAKPVVVVPFNPDQYIHGFRFQELGLGRCVINTSIMGITKLDWQYFQDLGKSMPIDKVIRAVDNMLANKDGFQAALKKYQKKFSGDGSLNAANVIESMLKLGS